MRGQINKLQAKHRRAGMFDIDELDKDTSAILMDYDPGDEVKSGIDYELDAIADAWEFVAENIERQAAEAEWKSYTRDDWAQLEHEYVERSEFTEQDLFDDILTEYESGGLTADEAQAKAKEYRKCSYRFCLNVFEPRRRNQWYCDADCRKREANAKIRYERTGTYLPAIAYKDNRNDTNQANYEEKEIAFNLAEAGNDESEESAESVATRIYSDNYKLIYGGKRNRKVEAIQYTKVTEKDLKDSQKAQLIRHYFPVNNAGDKAVI